MTTLPQSLLDKAKKYSKLTTAERREFIETLYNEPYLYSFQAIGDLVGTTGKKVRKHHPNMPGRNRQESQILALKSGRHIHPTQGRTRTEGEKIKISEAISESWKNSSQEHKDEVAAKSKKNWDAKTDVEKADFRKKAGTSLRKVATEGSQLEHYLHEKLVEAGHLVALHKKHMIVNDKLEIDLMIPAHKIVIEVDGPSHFKPIWGEESFKRTQKADGQKNALLLTKGYVVIRLRHEKSPTQKESRDLFTELLETVNNVVNSRPVEMRDRLILIGAKE